MGKESITPPAGIEVGLFCEQGKIFTEAVKKSPLDRQDESILFLNMCNAVIKNKFSDDAFISAVALLCLFIHPNGTTRDEINDKVIHQVAAWSILAAALEVSVGFLKTAVFSSVPNPALQVNIIQKLVKNCKGRKDCNE